MSNLRGNVRVRFRRNKSVNGNLISNNSGAAAAAAAAMIIITIIITLTVPNKVINAIRLPLNLRETDEMRTDVAMVLTAHPVFRPHPDRMTK